MTCPARLMSTTARMPPYCDTANTAAPFDEHWWETNGVNLQRECKQEPLVLPSLGSTAGTCPSSGEKAKKETGRSLLLVPAAGGNEANLADRAPLAWSRPSALKETGRAAAKSGPDSSTGSKEENLHTDWLFQHRINVRLETRRS